MRMWAYPFGTCWTPKMCSIPIIKKPRKKSFKLNNRDLGSLQIFLSGFCFRRSSDFATNTRIYFIPVFVVCSPEVLVLLNKKCINRFLAVIFVFSFSPQQSRQYPPIEKLLSVLGSIFFLDRVLSR